MIKYCSVVDEECSNVYLRQRRGSRSGSEIPDETSQKHFFWHAISVKFRVKSTLEKTRCLFNGPSLHHPQTNDSPISDLRSLTSNLCPPSIPSLASPCILSYIAKSKRRSGGTGRRAGLKIQWD